MTPKPEIQYIGQFYNYGSEARRPEPKVVPQQTRVAKAVQPQKKIRVFVDPVAVLSVVVAVAMVVFMSVGTVAYVRSVKDCEVMENYVADLRDVNIVMTHSYRSAIDWEYVESTALAMGMVPVSQVQHETVTITPRQTESEPTIWDDVRWFFNGLFE